jgi:uncharacterized protein YPO0396
MSIRIAREPAQEAAQRIRTRIMELEREVTYELARLSQKQQVFYQIEQQMMRLRPMAQEYELLSIAPLPTQLYRQRLKETGQAAQEYRRLTARRNALQQEIMREESRVYRLRTEVDNLNRLLTQYVAPPVQREELPVTPQQAERELRMLERMLEEARRMGDVDRMIEIQRRIDELARRMGYTVK